ncbi:7750_t:CDS:1, partial [Dentiscutata heterogama]
MTEQIRNLLENMFYVRTANSKNKFTKQKIYDELLKRVQHGKFDQSNVSK